MSNGKDNTAVLLENAAWQLRATSGSHLKHHS